MTATSREEVAGGDPPAPARRGVGSSGGPPTRRTGLLALGALGVVYGDIGTNPLFAMREAFDAHHLPLTDDNVIGLLSLMVWSLIVVISLKYLTFVMRADNDGEGGILALTTLAARSEGTGKGRRRALLVLLGLFGAALLYGDGVVTPSISVLAAVEGTTIAAPGLDHLVVPIAVAVLVLLFSMQHRGTAAIGRAFGPVMVVWFTTIGVLGAVHVVDRPGVLRAVDPVHGVRFFVHNGFDGFLVLGAVILVVVGGEALYADLGHFGRRPITVGWYALVLPSLVAVYMGQGALLLAEPDAIEPPDVPRALEERVVMRLGVDLSTMTYIVGRESAQVSSRHGMARWRKRLFAVLSRNVTSASVYLRLPPDQTVELRVPVEL